MYCNHDLLLYSCTSRGHRSRRGKQVRVEAAEGHENVPERPIVAVEGKRVTWRYSTNTPVDVQRGGGGGGHSHLLKYKPNNGSTTVVVKWGPRRGGTRSRGIDFLHSHSHRHALFVCGSTGRLYQQQQLYDLQYVPIVHSRVSLNPHTSLMPPVQRVLLSAILALAYSYVV